MIGKRNLLLVLVILALGARAERLPTSNKKVKS